MTTVTFNSEVQQHIPLVLRAMQALMRTNLNLPPATNSEEMFQCLTAAANVNHGDAKLAELLKIEPKYLAKSPDMLLCSSFELICILASPQGWQLPVTLQVDAHGVTLAITYEENDDGTACAHGVISSNNIVTYDLGQEWLTWMLADADCIMVLNLILQVGAVLLSDAGPEAKQALAEQQAQVTALMAEHQRAQSELPTAAATAWISGTAGRPC